MTEPNLNFVNCPDANGGHRMAYWQWGDATAGHVIVCVHGLSRQGRDFDVLARALCDRAAKVGHPLQVICPDVAGRGQSDWLKNPSGYQVPQYVADMLALLGQLRPARLDWVGTSMGGLIGMVICGQPGLLSGAGPSQSVKAPLGGSAGREAPSVGASGYLPVPVRRLVLNDVGPAVAWVFVERLRTYLGNTGRFASVQAAADAMWAISTTFGPHTPEQWLALSQHMVKPKADEPGMYELHYDPAIAVPVRSLTQAAAAQGEAALWQLYDNITASTLLTRGAVSDLLTPQTALAMTQRGPKARLVEFEGIGHAPTLIANNQVDTLANFLLD